MLPRDGTRNRIVRHGTILYDINQCRYQKPVPLFFLQVKYALNPVILTASEANGAKVYEFGTFLPSWRMTTFEDLAGRSRRSSRVTSQDRLYKTLELSFYRSINS